MPTAPDLLKAFAESKVLRKGSDADAMAGMKKTWKQLRAQRKREWKQAQKAKPAGGGSKYATKRKP